MKLTSSLCIVAISLAACGKVSAINPFKDKSPNAENPYANAVKYKCENNQSFYVRMLNNSDSAWVIFADHEVNLLKVNGQEGAYSSGDITLTIGADSTTLTDGEKGVYSACKP